jgi:hypothetical protein
MPDCKTTKCNKKSDCPPKQMCKSQKCVCENGGVVPDCQCPGKDLPAVYVSFTT